MQYIKKYYQLLTELEVKPSQTKFTVDELEDLVRSVLLAHVTDRNKQSFNSRFHDAAGSIMRRWDLTADPENSADAMTVHSWNDQAPLMLDLLKQEIDDAVNKSGLPEEEFKKKAKDNTIRFFTLNESSELDDVFGASDDYGLLELDEYLKNWLSWQNHKPTDKVIKTLNKLNLSDLLFNFIKTVPSISPNNSGLAHSRDDNHPDTYDEYELVFKTDKAKIVVDLAVDKKISNRIKATYYVSPFSHAHTSMWDPATDTLKRNTGSHNRRTPGKKKSSDSIKHLRDIQYIDMNKLTADIKRFLIKVSDIGR